MSTEVPLREMSALEGATLWQRLERVAGLGNRFGGTPGEGRCRDLVLTEFEAAGLASVRAEAFPFLAYEPESTSCTVLGEDLVIPSTALQYSADGVAEGEAVYLGACRADDVAAAEDRGRRSERKGGGRARVLHLARRAGACRERHRGARQHRRGAGWVAGPLPSGVLSVRSRGAVGGARAAVPRRDDRATGCAAPVELAQLRVGQAPRGASGSVRGEDLGERDRGDPGQRAAGRAGRDRRALRHAGRRAGCGRQLHRCGCHSRAGGALARPRAPSYDRALRLRHRGARRLGLVPLLQGPPGRAGADPRHGQSRRARTACSGHASDRCGR